MRCRYPYFGMTHSFALRAERHDAACLSASTLCRKVLCRTTPTIGRQKVVNVEGVGLGPRRPVPGFIQAYDNGVELVSDRHLGRRKNSGMDGTEGLSLYWCSGG